MSTNHAKCALITPEPYQGTVTRAGTPQAEGKTWSVIEGATYYDLPPLIIRRGDWVVCRDGIHCLYVKYHVAKERFGETDWIEHVTEKTWVDRGDFTCIFETAKDMVELEMI
ncbi:MAG: hypothetical protein WA081_16840 [Desulfosalsimonadaceae bacterium]